jgi:hypothetical protein
MSSSGRRARFGVTSVCPVSPSCFSGMPFTREGAQVSEMPIRPSELLYVVSDDLAAKDAGGGHNLPAARRNHRALRAASARRFHDLLRAGSREGT